MNSRRPQICMYSEVKTTFINQTLFSSLPARHSFLSENPAIKNLHLFTTPNEAAHHGACHPRRHVKSKKLKKFAVCSTAHRICCLASSITDIKTLVFMMKICTVCTVTINRFFFSDIQSKVKFVCSLRI